MGFFIIHSIRFLYENHERMSITRRSQYTADASMVGNRAEKHMNGGGRTALWIDACISPQLCRTYVLL
jgi:hypothetical protein